MENVYLVSIVQWEDTYNIGIFSTLDKAKKAVKNTFGFPIRDSHSLYRSLPRHHPNTWLF